MCIRVPYVGFVFGLVLQKIEDISSTLYTLTSQESSIHPCDRVPFSITLHTSLPRFHHCIRAPNRPPLSLKTSFQISLHRPRPAVQMAREDQRFARAKCSLGGVRLSELFLGWLARVDLKVGSSQLASRRGWLERTGVRSSELI